MEPWQVLLQFALGIGMDAIIDCGALLAGTSNRCVGWGGVGRKGCGVAGSERSGLRSVLL